MDYIKKSWEKTKSKDIPLDVMNHIAARGSFVVVKSTQLYRDFNEKTKPCEKSKSTINTDQLNYKIKEVQFALWMENLADNIIKIKNYSDISKIPRSEHKSAIIVGAGPSFEKKKHLDLLKSIDTNNFDIITTDRMLIYLLKNNVVPDIVVTADPGRTKVVDFYDSPLITPDIKTRAIIATMAGPNVVDKFPGEIYFFTPMIDDIDTPFSVTEAASMITKTSIVATGGNVGVACIYLASFLGYQNIVLTGMDLGYTMDTPIEKSQYYPIVKEADPTITPEKYRNLYVVEGYNPDVGEKFYTDITWKAHIDHLILQSIELKKNNITIVNATEGGSVFGGAIISMKFAEALKHYA